MIWVIEDRYESPLSIDTKKVTVALRLTSQWRFNDVIVTKNWILQIFAVNMLIFTFSPTILRKCDFDGIFFTNYEGNDYYNIHRKFQVHSTSIFGLGAKTKTGKWQPTPSTPNFDSLPYPYHKVRWSFFFSKMTSADDPTTAIWWQKQAF